MKTKLLGTSLAVFALLVCAGVASAATADQIQPASDVTYNENMRVNGTIHTDSLRVGTAGQGGVTFFNGSILNEDASEPLTVADDLRVDGAIWRTEVGGSNNIKISDSLQPTTTSTYDLGTSSNRWDTLYANEVVVNNHISLSGDEIETYDLTVNGTLKGSTGNAIDSYSIRPKSDLTYGLGDSLHRWTNVNANTLYADLLASDGAILTTTSSGSKPLIVQLNSNPVFEVYGSGNVNVSGNIYDNTDDIVDFTDVIVPGWNNSACSATLEGAIRYDSGNKQWDGCDGTTWQKLNN